LYQQELVQRPIDLVASPRHASNESRKGGICRPTAGRRDAASHQNPITDPGAPETTVTGPVSVSTGPVNTSEANDGGALP
jgi:hypothetical protein